MPRLPSVAVSTGGCALPGRPSSISFASTARVPSTSMSSNDAANRSLQSALLPPMALWYTEAPRAVAAAGGAVGLFSSLAELLGLWHEMRRGSHNGAHDIGTDTEPREGV